MHIINCTITAIVAEFIFYNAAAVLDGVYKVMSEKQIEYTEYARLFHGTDDCLEFSEAQRRMKLRQSFQYYNSVGCDVYAFFRKAGIQIGHNVWIQN